MKLYGILALVLICFFSYLAFVVVESSENLRLTTENKELYAQKAVLETRLKEADLFHKRDLSSIKDGLIVGMPDRKNIIDAIFANLAQTQPSTRPATQPEASPVVK